MTENYIDKIEVDGVERPIRDTSGSVRYDAAQSLTDAQKAQARGNISALNGQFLVAESAGGQIGWYRITEPFVQYNTSGYLTVSHAYASGGASELLLGVSSAPDTHGKLQCLRSVGQINSVPYISNARLVKVDGSTLALDLYVSGTGKNDWNLQLCNCGHNPITLTTPTFISTDDTLPSGETLAAVMEYQNPPMLLGVEYRTTERYLGKPVYKKLIEFPSLTGRDYQQVNSNVGFAISAIGEVRNPDNTNFWVPMAVNPIAGQDDGPFPKIAFGDFYSASVGVVCASNSGYIGQPARVLVTYYKATD